MELPCSKNARSTWTDVLLGFGIAIGGIWCASHAPFSIVVQNRGLFAAVLFLYVPMLLLWHRRQAFAPYAKSTGFLRRSLAAYGLTSVIFLGLFSLVYFLLWRSPHCPTWHIPRELLLCKGESHWVSPSTQQMVLLIINSLFVAALPEEFFFRGFLQTRLTEVLRPYQAIVVTSLLFAFGHWVILQTPSVLLVFFPSLLFGWLRVRTGSILAGVLFHASCNVFLALTRWWFS